MNREILFRGKRKLNGNWVYGYYVYNEDENKHLIYAANLTMACFEVIPETVGQFTSRTDMKDVKIFSGDINHDGGICIWNEDDASFCWDYSNLGIEPMGAEEDWCEITGNIHETK